MYPMGPPGTLPHPSLIRGTGQPVPPPGAPITAQINSDNDYPPAPGGPPTLKNAKEPILKKPSDPRLKAHVPLAKVRVLYIGSAVPTQSAIGLDAVQQPLLERYQTDGDGATNVPGIDSWVTIFSSGLLLQYTADKSSVAWFPIHTLHVSSAVKCIPYMQAKIPIESCKFVSLDSPAAKASQHPPIFATIMRRTTGRRVLECHAFICKSDDAALACVQATTHAYEHKEGWIEDEPPKELHQTLEAKINTSDPDAEPDLPLFQPSGKEFEDNPNIQGYFYNYKPELVRNFNVHHPSSTKPRKPQMSSVVPPPNREPQPRPLPLVPGPDQRGTYGPLPVIAAREFPDHAPGYTNPYLLPTTGQALNYFDDWDSFQDTPVMVFPGPYISDDQYKRTIRDIRGKRQRRRLYDVEPTYDRRVATYDRPPPPRRVEYADDYYTGRWRGPPSDYMDDMGNRYYSGDDDYGYGYGYRDELPRPERRAYGQPDPDMFIYAPTYRDRFPRGDRGGPIDDERAWDPYRMNDYAGYGGLTRDLGYLP